MIVQKVMLELSNVIQTHLKKMVSDIQFKILTTFWLIFFQKSPPWFLHEKTPKFCWSVQACIIFIPPVKSARHTHVKSVRFIITRRCTCKTSWYSHTNDLALLTVFISRQISRNLSRFSDVTNVSKSNSSRILRESYFYDDGRKFLYLSDVIQVVRQEGHQTESPSSSCHYRRVKTNYIRKTKSNALASRRSWKSF